MIKYSANQKYTTDGVAAAVFTQICEMCIRDSTGDSFCSAPMLTISEECQKRLQEQAYKIVESVQVIGGTRCV